MRRGRLLGFSLTLALSGAPCLAFAPHARADEPAKPAPAPAAPKLAPPRPLNALEAEYPLAPGGKTQGEADVVLELTIAADGSVKEARVVKGEPPFSDAASRAAPAWRFEPATRDEKPVSARIRVLVHFTPPEPEPPPEAPAAEASNGTNPKPAAAPARKPTAVAPIEVLAIGERRAPGTVTLGRAEVRLLPGAFGDPFRAIESLPGVTPIFSGVPFFYVRGAPPGNVGYFLDNVRVPYLYHLALGPSVVNPALVDRVDLYPGGYPAKYGRFAGGIVAGETTTPKAELRGEANIRLFDAGGLVEVPLGDRGSALVGGRYSYTAAVLSLFAPDTTLNYWDYQARVSYDLSPNQHLTVFAFGGHDYLGQTVDGVEQALFDVQFHRVDLRYDVELGARTRLRQALTFGLDRTGIGGTDGIASRDFLFGSRSQIVHRASESVLIRAGVDANVDAYDLYAGDDKELQRGIDALFPPRQDITVGFYGDAVIDAGRGVEFTPGARVDLFGSAGNTAMSADVRLSMKMPVTSRLRLQSTMGLAHQPPAFVLPIPGLSIGSLAGGLQEAAQTSAGLEADLPLGFKASATMFLNGFFNMNDVLGTASAAGPAAGPGGGPGPGGGGGGGMGGGGDGNVDSGGAAAVNDRALGRAFGLEIYVRRKLTERIGGYVAYTLSRSTRNYGQTSGLAQFDRTHVLNGALSFDAGRGWRLGTRLVFYTGLPIAEADALIWGKSRTDPFFRIDGRIEKRWNFRKRGWISLVIEMLNASLSVEHTGVTCNGTTCTPTEIGPVTVPSIGVEGGL